MIVSLAWPVGQRSLYLLSRLRSIVDRGYEAYDARDFDAYRQILDEDVEFVVSVVAVREWARVIDHARGSIPGVRTGPRRVVAETADTLADEARTENSDLWKFRADRVRGIDTLCGMGGRDANVHHRHHQVSEVLARHLHQLTHVARLADDLEARTFEQARDPLAYDEVIIRDDNTGWSMSASGCGVPSG